MFLPLCTLTLLHDPLSSLCLLLHSFPIPSNDLSFTHPSFISIASTLLSIPSYTFISLLALLHPSFPVILRAFALSLSLIVAHAPSLLSIRTRLHFLSLLWFLDYHYDGYRPMKLKKLNKSKNAIIPALLLYVCLFTFSFAFQVFFIVLSVSPNIFFSPSVFL